MNRESYSERFKNAEAVDHYVTQVYGDDQAANIIWDLEKIQIDQLLKISAIPLSEAAYLDFACGTGRVVSFLEERMRESIGIDISPEMIRIARERVQVSELFSRDILKEPLDQKFDVITAFRFLRNAEPSLRLNIFRKLAGMLRDKNSVLIFNNHGNPCSRAAIASPIKSLWLRENRQTGINFVTHAEVMELMNEVGLQIEHRLGSNIAGKKLSRLINRNEPWKVDRQLSDGFLGRFGMNQMYLARLR